MSGSWVLLSLSDFFARSRFQRSPLRSRMIHQLLRPRHLPCMNSNASASCVLTSILIFLHRSILRILFPTRRATRLSWLHAPTSQNRLHHELPSGDTARIEWTDVPELFDTLRFDGTLFFCCPGKERPTQLS